MEISQQTTYEIESLKRILEWEWNYSTIKEREAVIDRLKYSISEDIISRILASSKKNTPNKK